MALRRRLLAFLLMVTLMGTIPRPAVAIDPWYNDVHRHHWAYGYINVLWSEGITDGLRWYSWFQRRTFSFFYPDKEITRGELTLMMAKAFRLSPITNAGPTFRDVPSNLLLYERIRALPWIESARREGMIKGTPSGYFYPGKDSRRDEAVAILVRSLGLGGHAANMSMSEADRYLKPFRDWYAIEPSLYREMATAVKLKILEGYPDRTLRPGRHLTRAEAATIIYRSALFTVDASPNPFSPDGDGIEDYTTLNTRTLKNRNVTNWRIYVGTAGRTVFRTFNRHGGGRPPTSLTWDGQDDRGRPLAPGTYYYWGWIQDRQGQTFQAVLKPITLEHKSLRGSLTPTSTPPGGTLHLEAITTGNARNVTAAWPGEPALPLKKILPIGDTALWRADYRVPIETADGSYTVALKATYNRGERRLDLTYQVESPLSLQPSLRPNPAWPGREVTATARSIGPFETVSVRWPWRVDTVLDRRGPDTWEASVVVPEGFEPGRYTVPFTGRTARGRRAEASVTLAIRLDPRGEVQIILTE